MNTYNAGELTASGEPLLGFAISLIFVLLAIAVIIAILMIISTWKIFKKAGESGWKALIPFYSDYIFYKIAWKRCWFLIMFLSTIATSALSVFMEEAATYGAVMFGSLLSFAFGIFILVIEIMLYVKLAKAFRKDGAFAVGLILLPFIFLPILAFGAAEYQKPGNDTDPRILPEADA